MAVMKIGRLSLAGPSSWAESVGSNPTIVGATPVPAEPAPLGIASTHVLHAPTDTIADRQRLRRQWRSLLNNVEYASLGIFVQWDDDTEQNGWYVPGESSFDRNTPLISQASFSSGMQWVKVGMTRTHWTAAKIDDVLDMRTASAPIDILRRVFSSAFSAKPIMNCVVVPKPVTASPPNGSDLVYAPYGAYATRLVSQPGNGFTNGAYFFKYDAADSVGSLVAYDIALADIGKGDVIVYDRRGDASLPTTGFGATWEEVYGEDYPFTAGQVPIMQSPWHRLSWEQGSSSTFMSGFKIDAWNGTQWEYIGKMCVMGVTIADNLYRVQLIRYTPTCAVLKLSLANDARTIFLDLYVTLKRDTLGPKFELYVKKADSTASNTCALRYFVAATTRTYAYTGKTSHTVADLLSTAAVNTVNANFDLGTADWNYVFVSGAGVGGMDTVLTVAQSGLTLTAINADNRGTSVAKNAIDFQSTVGYVQVTASCPVHKTDSVLDNSDMTAGSGVTLNATDATADGGTAASGTATVNQVHVSKTVSAFTDNPTVNETFRVLARVRTSASTLNVYLQHPSGNNTTVTTTSTSYVWLDLGTYTASGNSLLQVHMWANAAATIYFDRMLVVPETSGDGMGTQDLGSRTLCDATVMDRQVNR